MKKAGIIVGLVFIIAAIVICLIAFRKPSEEVVNNTEVIDTQNNSTNNQNIENNQVVEPEVTVPIQSEPVVQPEPTVVEKIITKEISGVKTISEGSLGMPISEKEVIVYISNKRILLVDENTESTNPKMLTYCFDVLTPENESLILFVTNSVYTQYNVNDKLMVKYQMYQNDNGIKFPLVLSVSAVN